MTHKDAQRYASKHPPGTKTDPRIAEAVKQKMANGKITCAAAHEIARDLKVSPGEVGVSLDLLEVRINECQLGLFGYRPQRKVVTPAQSVAPEMEDAVREAIVNHRISCLACWEIARRFGTARMYVAAACEALGVKIVSCQLGSF